MIKYLLGFAGTAVVFVALDALWLKFMALKMYRPVQESLLSGQVKILPAVLFYVLFLSGLVFFAVRPALASGRWTDAALTGAILGVFGYGTYALTNHAIMRDWQWSLTATDLGWGAVVSAAGATAGYFLAKVAG